MARLSNGHNAIEIPISRVHELLSYDAETGILRWRVDRGRRFKAGDIAGYTNRAGYRSVKIDNHQFFAHRLAWALHFNAWPTDQIDHINGDKLDNRIENLRVVTHTVNIRNVGLRATNKSGARGVSFYKPTGKWHARIHINDARIHLGFFNTKQEAIEQRKLAEWIFWGDEPLPVHEKAASARTPTASMIPNQP